jgi:hypothetical protein
MFDKLILNFLVTTTNGIYLLHKELLLKGTL